MGIFDDIGNAISSAANAVADAADAVADAVETAVNVAEDAVADAVETAGNAIDDAVDWVADKAENIPVVGGVVAGALRWVGGYVSGIFDFVGAVVKGIGGIVFKVMIGDALRIGAGILRWNWRQVGERALRIVHRIGGAIVLIGGKAVSWIQSVLFLQANERRLTDEEYRLLKRVFWESVALYNVRVIQGWSGIYGVNPNPFTLGNTIYLKDYNFSTDADVLVHECTHVWQYQHIGARYTSEAIAAQWFLPNKGYPWKDEIERGNTEWVDFNKEAQAQFFQDIYTDGVLDVAGDPPSHLEGNGAFYDADGNTKIGTFIYPLKPKGSGTDYTGLANRAVDVVRGQLAIRLSNVWS